MDGAAVKAGFENCDLTWDEDLIKRMNPHLMTRLLREQVPSLEFVDWRVTRVECGMAESVLPVNFPSTNQHFTHQAALWVLAADYTGGTAIISVLRGWPAIGVHPVCSDRSISIWLIGVQIKYLSPSIGDLTIRCSIDEPIQKRIRRRFLNGSTVFEKVTIEFFNGEDKVGIAELSYFAKQTEKLRPRTFSMTEKNTLFDLKQVTSAEMIAGVRAIEHGRMIDDPYAETMARQRGIEIARRFCQHTPQLSRMVAARTLHLDRALMEFATAGGRNILIVGAGLDMRPFRLQYPSGTKIFEIDLPSMNDTRSERLADLGIATPKDIERIRIDHDVLTFDIVDQLSATYDLTGPLFIAWEGMNMYFNEDIVTKFLKSVRPLMRHRDSRLWMDIVERSAIETPEKHSASVQNFMLGMQKLGEPFVYGPESAEALARIVGMQCREAVTAQDLIPGATDPVHEVYRFCLLSAINEVDDDQIVTI